MAAARSLSLGLRLGRGSIYVNTAGKWTGCPFPYCISVMQTALSTSTPLPFVFHQYRYSSFFNKLTADELWRGVLAEFGAGARKGRGKRTKRKMKKDLNRGQMIGEGRAGFLWPGLNAPVVKSGTIQSIGKRDQSQQEVLQAEVLREREEWDKRRKMKIKRERGWTGNSWGGISLGPPDPGPNGETFEDFDSRVIEVMQDEREHTRGQHTLDSFAAYRPRTISSSSSGPSGNRFQRFVVSSKDTRTLATR